MEAYGALSKSTENGKLRTQQISTVVKATFQQPLPRKFGMSAKASVAKKGGKGAKKRKGSSDEEEDLSEVSGCLQIHANHMSKMR